MARQAYSTDIHRKCNRDIGLTLRRSVSKCIRRLGGGACRGDVCRNGIARRWPSLFTAGGQNLICMSRCSGSCSVRLLCNTVHATGRPLVCAVLAGARHGESKGAPVRQSFITHLMRYVVICPGNNATRLRHHRDQIQINGGLTCLKCRCPNVRFPNQRLTFHSNGGCRPVARRRAAGRVQVMCAVRMQAWQ